MMSQAGSRYKPFQYMKVNMQFILTFSDLRQNKRCFMAQGSKNKVLIFPELHNATSISIQGCIWVAQCCIANRRMIHGVPGLLLILIIIRHQPLHHLLFHGRGIDGDSNFHAVCTLTTPSTEVMSEGFTAARSAVGS